MNEHYFLVRFIETDLFGDFTNFYVISPVTDVTLLHVSFSSLSPLGLNFNVSASKETIVINFDYRMPAMSLTTPVAPSKSHSLLYSWSTR